MKTYARIEGGLPVEIIPPFAVDGKEIEITERFPPDIVATLIEWPSDQPLPVQDAPAPAIPQTVTMRQARLALLAAGKLASVKAVIDGLEGPEGEAARIEWEFSATVERASPIVAMLAAGVGLDNAALDDLFAIAASL